MLDVYPFTNLPIQLIAGSVYSVNIVRFHSPFVGPQPGNPRFQHILVSAHRVVGTTIHDLRRCSICISIKSREHSYQLTRTSKRNLSSKNSCLIPLSKPPTRVSRRLLHPSTVHRSPSRLLLSSVLDSRPLSRDNLTCHS